MTSAEKILYHQIHPAKLFADISSSVVSLWLFWQHSLWLGLLFHFLFAVIGSSLVIRFADLEKLKQSPFGKYVKKYMNRKIEALRLAGDVVTVFGAWYHSWLVIVAGFLIVLFAWYKGKLFPSVQSV